MDNIKTFSNNEFGNIRTSIIDNEIWFVGKDIATSLGFTNTRKAIIDHVDKDDKIDGVTVRDSIGREQNPVMINESGVYALVFGSKLESAKRFKHWVTSCFAKSSLHFAKQEVTVCHKEKSYLPLLSLKHRRQLKKRTRK